MSKEKEYFEYTQEQIKQNKMPLSYDAWKSQYKKIRINVTKLYLDMHKINKEDFLTAIEKVIKNYNIDKFEFEHEEK